jgi:hypothetical protein
MPGVPLDTPVPAVWQLAVQVGGRGRSIADPDDRAQRELIRLTDSPEGDARLVATTAVKGELFTKDANWGKKESSMCANYDRSEQSFVAVKHPFNYHCRFVIF